MTAVYEVEENGRVRVNLVTYARLPVILKVTGSEALNASSIDSHSSLGTIFCSYMRNRLSTSERCSPGSDVRVSIEVV